MAAAACSMCGATTPTDARYCPQCGTRLDIDVVDLTNGPTSNPDTPQTTAPPRANRLLVGLAAALVLALGGLWLFSGGDTTSDDTTDQPQPQNPDQPTTDNALAIADQSLETVLSIRPTFAQVEEVLRVGEAASVGLVRRGESVFWLTGDYVGSIWPATDTRVRNVRVRRSDDGGTTWTEVAHDLPADARLGAVTAADGELVAAGTDGDAALTIWRSDDGTSWVAETVSEEAAPVGRVAVPTMIHSSPTGLILLVDHTPDISVLEPILPLDASHLGALIGGQDQDRVDFIGPMGIRFAGPALDDPSVTDEILTAIDELGDPRSRDHSGAIWLGTADGWGGADLAGQPTDVTVLADGSPLVIGFTGAGTTEWTLDERGEWRNRFASPDLVSVTTWRGQTIATGSGDLRVRNEIGGWEPYGLFNALPRTLQDGFLVSAAGDGDILAISLISSREGRAIAPPGPALLAKDGFVLTYDISMGTLVVTTPTDTRIDMAPWQPSLPQGVSIDTETPALVVADPGSDAEAAFSFAELAQLERAATTLSSIFEEAEVLVSVDGRTWARGDVPENAFATELLPFGDGVLAVIGRFGAPGAGLTTDGVRILRVSYS